MLAEMYSSLEAIEETVSLPCQHLEAIHFLWLVEPFLYFQSQQCQAKPLQCFHLSSASLFASKDSCDYIKPTYQSRIISPPEGQLISNLNSICSFNFSLPCDPRYLVSDDQVMDIFGRPLFCPSRSFFFFLLCILQPPKILFYVYNKITVRTNKINSISCRIQNQYTKISNALIH